LQRLTGKIYKKWQNLQKGVSKFTKIVAEFTKTVSYSIYSLHNSKNQLNFVVPNYQRRYNCMQMINDKNK